MGRTVSMVLGGLVACLGFTPMASGQWLEFEDVTATNLLAANPAIGGATDVEEKDLAVGDFDLDGDLDLVIVRKTPFTTWGPRPNVIFMNISGVLTDGTEAFAPELAAPDNARDVRTGDFDGDGRLDLIIAISGTATEDGDQPRIFMNQGGVGPGWLGFVEEPQRLPFLLSNLGRPPNFCSVGVGDLTGNAVDDLYFVDYRNDLEDRLFINDGFGLFTDETISRLPPGFRVSGFGTTAEIADMNADGFRDIIKNSAGSLDMTYNDGTGNFTVAQTLVTSAPYSFAIGDLNNDSKNDIFIVQDPQDQFQLNASAPGAIPVTWNSVALSDSPSTAGFGGSVHIVDVDVDDDMDVVVADTDIDVAGCSRRLAFLENDGQTPIPGISDPFDPVYTEAHRQGTFDALFADFNGDGTPDLWVGHCSGNSLYFQVPDTFSVNPPDNLQCDQMGIDVVLQWTNAGVYTGIDVSRDGIFLATIPGAATSYSDLGPASGNHSYTVVATVDASTSPMVSCLIQVSMVDPPSNLTCAQFDTDVVLSWLNHGGVGGGQYDEITVSRNGSKIAILPGTATSFVDEGPAIGFAAYAVIARIGSEQSAPATCSLNIAAANATDLVIDFTDDDGGETDSASAIIDALLANARVPNHVFVDTLADLEVVNIELNDFERVWVELGTFPANHVLSGEEGQTLADFVEDGSGGGDLILTGGDSFCFDARTAVHALTGVASACSDGFNGVANIEGVVLPECDAIVFDLVEFAGEDTAVDRLEPLEGGQPILSANVGGSVFTAGVVNVLDQGMMISQSVEFGGIGDDHDKSDLVDLYLHCLPSGFPAPIAAFAAAPTMGPAPLTVEFTSQAGGLINVHTWMFGDGDLASTPNPVHTYNDEGSYTVTYTVAGPGGNDTIVKEALIAVGDGARFLRGDADGDGVFNGLIDSLFVLAFGFIPGSATPPCFDAADVDDDGVFNGLLDALFLLDFGFVPDSPEPPPPGVAACGFDPTADNLDCQILSCP